MAPKTKREQELELQIAELKGMMQAVMAGQSKPVHTGKPVVGIRNISSYTIGLINKIPGEEGEIQLHVEPFGEHNPSARAVISETYWNTLKKGKEVRKGLLVRDDSFLTTDNVAAKDNPEEIPAEFYVNAIEDPFTWIESKTDDELQQAIFALTSEASLRRLQAAVTHKIREVGQQFPDDSERGKKALRALPSKYHRVEQLVLEHLDEFLPNSKNYQNERNTTARF